MMVAAALLAGAQDPPPVLLAGVLDLPVLEGSSWSADCGGWRERTGEDAAVMECVVAPLGRIETLTGAYRDLAGAAGWRPGYSHLFTSRMEKPGADGRCDGLAMTILWDSDAAPEPAHDTPGVLALRVEKNIRCENSPAP